MSLIIRHNVVTKEGSISCSQNQRRKRRIVSIAPANEISVDVAVVTVLSELFGISAFKEEEFYYSVQKRFLRKFL